MISIKNLTKKFKTGKFQLQAINLDILAGKFVVLVGPSGSGKSTLLRLIAGLDKADSGHIVLDGNNADNLAPKDRNIAMVFQNYALYPHLTVSQNIAFPLKIKKMSSAAIVEKVEKTAKLLHIDDLLDRYPRQLSGGQKQRVAIGRCLVRDPKIFLFDEPLSNLDVHLRDDLRQQILELHQKLGQTTIYVTHDQHEAMSLAQTLVVMKEGKIEQVDTPQEVYTNPVSLFVNQFIGHPPANKFSGNFSKNGEFIVEGQTICKIPKALANHDEAVYGCIRPVDIDVYDQQLPSNEALKFKLHLQEYSGNTDLLTFTNGTTSVLVTTKSSPRKIGGTYYLHFPASSFFWFNNLGQRLISK